EVVTTATTAAEVPAAPVPGAACVVAAGCGRGVAAVFDGPFPHAAAPIASTTNGVADSRNRRIAYLHGLDGRSGAVTAPAPAARSPHNTQAPAARFSGA